MRSVHSYNRAFEMRLRVVHDMTMKNSYRLCLSLGLFFWRFPEAGKEVMKMSISCSKRQILLEKANSCSKGHLI